MPKSSKFSRKLIGVILGVIVVAIVGVLFLVFGLELGISESSYEENRAAVESVETMARENSDNSATEEQLALQQAVISERLPYGEVNDLLVYGHFVFPADMVEPLPAVIVIHEWFGLTDDIRAMADRLAAEGYIVLAIDLYAGETATSPGGARQHMLRVVENPETAEENIRKAYEFVNDIAGAPHVGALGWGLGGGWALNTAFLFPNDLDAVVVYYGQVSSDEELLRPLNAPVQGHFGSADTSISVASVRDAEAALERLRKDYDIHVYRGAEHGFAIPGGDAFNAEAAAQSWDRTLEFLSSNLSPPADAEE